MRPNNRPKTVQKPFTLTLLPNYEEIGVDGDNVKIRYHFNFCGAALSTTERRGLVHNLHSDSARCPTDEDEIKTERAVAAVTIRASKEQMIVIFDNVCVLESPTIHCEITEQICVEMNDEI